MDARVVQFFGDFAIPAPGDVSYLAKSLGELRDFQRFERWDRIVQSANAVIECFPLESRAVLIAKVSALFKLGRFEEAKMEIEGMNGDFCDELKLVIAEIPFYEAKNASLAILNIDRLMEEEREKGGDDFILFRVHALVRQADLYEKLRKFTCAIDCLHSALECADEIQANERIRMDIWIKMGNIFYSVGDLQNCKLAFDHAQSADSNCLFAREIAIPRVVILVAEEKFQEALMLLEQITLGDSLDPLVVNNLAVCSINTGNSLHAIKILEDLIRKNPVLNLTLCVVLNLIQLYESIPLYSSRVSTLEKLCSVYDSSAFIQAKKVLSELKEPFSVV